MKTLAICKIFITTFAVACFAAGASAATKVISTAAQLAAVADDLAGTYALDADIDLGGADWTPIGNNATPFTGEFYGNGHVISNLFCTTIPETETPPIVAPIAQPKSPR